MTIETDYNIGDTIYFVQEYDELEYKDCNFCNNNRLITNGIYYKDCPFCKVKIHKVVNGIVDEIQYTIDIRGIKLSYMMATYDEDRTREFYFNFTDHSERIFKDKEKADYYFENKYFKG